MKKSWKYYGSLIMVVSMLVTGCTSNQNNKTQSETGVSDIDTSNSDNKTVITTSSISTIVPASTVVVDTEFSASDLDVGYEDSTSTKISLSNIDAEISGKGATFKDGTLTITNEGTYVVSGSIADGQIIVDASDSDKVQLVLNGVSITSLSHAAVYVKNADKVFITLVEGTVNTLIDGALYVQIDDKTVDAVIYSTADLTINGSGTLNITGNYKHGILSKDELVITGGIFNIKAVKDAINGKDAVKIKDGTFVLESEVGNGIQSKNGDDTTKGYVYICGGTITVLTCEEGIEGTAVVIADGTINITAKDDGINAAAGTASTDVVTASTTNDEFIKASGGQGAFDVDNNCYILIAGGNISVDASGDGIDSNGNVYVAGGYLYVNGPTNNGDASLDYNGTAEITGGTVVVAGSSGMAQGFSTTSTQYSILHNLTSKVSGKTEVVLKDKDDNIILSFTPDKDYQSIVISSKELIRDETYTLTAGEQTAEITLSSVVTSNGSQGMGGGGMGGKREWTDGEKPEGMPERGQGQRPDGEKPSGEIPSGEIPSGEVSDM